MAPTKGVLPASPWMPTGQPIRSSRGRTRVSDPSHRALQTSAVGTSVAWRSMTTRSRNCFSKSLPNARRLATTLSARVPRIVRLRPRQRNPSKASTHRAMVVRAASAPAPTPSSPKCCHQTSPKTCLTTRWR